LEYNTGQSVSTSASYVKLARCILAVIDDHSLCIPQRNTSPYQVSHRENPQRVPVSRQVLHFVCAPSMRSRAREQGHSLGDLTFPESAALAPAVPGAAPVPLNLVARWIAERLTLGGVPARQPSRRQGKRMTAGTLSGNRSTAGGPNLTGALNNPPRVECH